MPPRRRTAGDREELDGMIADIEAEFGAGAIMRMSGRARVEVDVIPSGTLGLDLALGVQGFPRGRIIEIFGPESSGKTTLVYHIFAEAQRLGGVCVFIDAEHAMDPLYASAVGVNLDTLLVSQPDYGEQALEIGDRCIRSGLVDVVAIDSVAALTPKTELEGHMEDQAVGLHARLMSKALRKYVAELNNRQTLLVFTNQLREKIGQTMGSPITTPGGRALKFYATMRLDVRRVGSLKEGEHAVANRVKVRAVKNKVAAPFGEVELELVFGRGFSNAASLLDLGAAQGVLRTAGAYAYFGDVRLGQGRANVRTFLDEHPDTARAIEAAVLAKLGEERRKIRPIRDTPASPAEVASALAAAGRRPRSRRTPADDGGIDDEQPPAPQPEKPMTEGGPQRVGDSKGQAATVADAEPRSTQESSDPNAPAHRFAAHLDDLR